LNFVNPEINWAGLYAFNVYVRGIPHVIVVDDAVTAGKNGKKPDFAQIGGDNSIWGALLEKAWAKANGNYERISLGSNTEAVEFLTNAPYKYYQVKKLNAESIWTMASEADAKNFIMVLGTSSESGSDKDNCLFNLPCGHAYSLIGVVTVWSADKTQSQRLFKVRNPWRKENGYSGSWKDDAPIWKTVGADGLTFAQQAG
jgi:hypothetical protein